VVNAGDVDLLVRALSMGKLHHAMMGTAAVAIGTAAAIPGTLVNLAPAVANAVRCASAIRPAPCAWARPVR
jgi:2-methylaconitate cis-trans-isomerase PrpF